ncbi:hypothetical protein [Limimaricola hongkongensis]|uniref:Type I secretion target repeat protein n=1 Tax=Limimaricola hongkongensis DSM 17492 TaxID=1122180 RepID=A0A017HC83_9RHOB|nr:hypothetical protein [Limimaricola hongkongensis]EYD72077.1 hypothetical protein Lokhon_02149 [Limimaricola hongkongensis DSM 17492]
MSRWAGLRAVGLVLTLWAALAGGPSAARAAPALGMNLAGISDWSTQHPFLDLMKTSRPWIGHLSGQWGGVDAEAMAARGHVAPGGRLLSLPDEVSHVGTLILTDQPEAAVSLSGRYVLRHEGRGAISVGGRGRAVSRAPGEIRFDYAPGPGAVEIEIRAIDPGDPLRDITVVREDRLPHAGAGALFNPDWLARISDLRLLRFMDWMQTNGAVQRHWADRPRPGDQRWTDGVPVEVMARLANEIGADPWVTLPHMADDDYVRRFATHLRDHLDPRLKIHAEWSNEVWNFGFGQARWAQARARDLWGADAPGDAWMQFAGLRAAQVADIWAEVFGAQARTRLVRVLATQTDWPGLEAAALDAPLAVAQGARPPAESFDAYAVTGYVGHEVGADADLGDWRGWIADGTAKKRALAMLRADVADLSGRLWPHHAKVAARHGLRLVMYEAGPHLVAGPKGRDDPALTGFLADLTHAPEIPEIIDGVMAGWRAAGGTQATAYLDIAPASRWGSWGALRHLDDASPLWEAWMRHNRDGVDWERRAPGSFDDGLVLEGAAAAERLVGTVEEDLLLGGGGDDVIHAGPGDRINGGPGRDRVVLPAAWRARPVAWEGARLAIGTGPSRIVLAGIEEIAYGSETGPATLTETLR